MKTKNDWCTSNLNDRFLNKNIKFEVYLKPYKFNKIDFNTACEKAATEIYEKYKNLYLAFSGGMDSDYILRLFHRLNIPITPIIVCYGNETENWYAHNTCKQLKVTPIIIKPTTEKFMKTFYEEIYLKYNGVGIHSTQVYFAYDVIKDGTLITGGNTMGHGQELIGEDNFADVSEYDYYIPNSIDLLTYTPEIIYSIMESVKNNMGVEWNIFKSNLYGIEHRDKIRARYDSNINLFLSKLSTIENTTMCHHSWNKKEMFKIFDGYVND